MKKMKILFLFLLLNSTISLASSLDSWKLMSNWELKDSYYTYTVQKDNLSESCPEGEFLLFPNVMHSIQSLTGQNGRLILSNGDANRRHTLSIYNSLILDCRLILPGEAVTWTIQSPFKSFNRVMGAPHLQTRFKALNRPDVSHLLVAGALLLISFLFLLWFKLSSVREQAMALAGFSCFMGIFFLSSVAGLLGLHAEILTVDKVAAFSVGASIGLYIIFLYKKFHLNPKIAKISAVGVLLASTTIPFLSSGDHIQNILSFIFIPGILAVWYSTYSHLKEVATDRLFDREKLLSLLGLLSFAVSTSSDIAYTVGLHSFGMTLGYGVLGSVIFFAQSMQLDIQKTYTERDYLRKNLEKEVLAKTEELQTAQAELIQSAKLASLGTLSAGIAHEINNSINYVNGALGPIEKMIQSSVQGEKERAKADRLIVVMKDGLNLTMEIIKSLRTFTGLNQAQLKEAHFDEIFKSVLTILNSKIRGKYTVNLDASPNAVVFGNLVGLNQVVMNLVSNSLDAMPKGGTLDLKASRENDWVEIIIRDTGTGIPAETQNRMFEPFFTSKEVGKGSGLGLYIVKKEIERHSGTIRVESSLGSGTKFSIRIPANQLSNDESRQAG